MSQRILIVDKDPEIGGFLRQYLKHRGFDPTWVRTGQDMRKALAGEAIDLCILDIDLPDTNGFLLMREIRLTSNIPVIVLSALRSTIDRIYGLEVGADDFVVKPFEPLELVVRIRTVLRRLSKSEIGWDTGEPVQLLLQFGPWLMNLSTRTVTHKVCNEDVRLTSMEFNLLQALAEQPRTVLSRDKLIDLTRGPSNVVGDRAIDVHIMRIRKKIEPVPAQPTFIKTCRGIGYCLSSNVMRLHRPDECNPHTIRKEGFIRLQTDMFSAPFQSYAAR